MNETDAQKQDDEAQSKRFIEKAKELGIEVDADEFGRLIGQIAPVKQADVKPAEPTAKDSR